MKIYLLLFFAIVALGCEKPLGARSSIGFKIENRTEMKIATLPGYSYPDTSIPIIEGREWDLKRTSSFGITSYHYFRYKNFSEFYGQLPQDTLSIFIFHADTVAKYNWEEIRSGYKILKRYDLSQDDLKNMGYIIQYR